MKAVIRLQNTQLKLFNTAERWEGRTLYHAAFKTRLNYSFDSFPDINFEILTVISDGTDVAITWIMSGINGGKIGDFSGQIKQLEPGTSSYIISKYEKNTKIVII